MDKLLAIFDLDGTLLYTLTDLRTAVNAAMHRFGWQERTFEEMRHFVGNGIRNLMDHAVPGGEKNPLFRINHALCDQIYDLMEEYGEEHDLPEGWWLDEADEEEVLLRL